MSKPKRPVKDDARYQFRKEGEETYSLSFNEPFALRLHDILTHHASLLRMAAAQPDAYSFAFQGYGVTPEQAEEACDALGDAICAPMPAVLTAPTPAQLAA